MMDSTNSAPDFVYERPSLVEVICDLRWQLRQIQTFHPEARIDPHYEFFVEEMRNAAAEAGFNVVERTQPEEVPIELRPFAPEWRFRLKQGHWPLFQIGPGIMSVNIVPPYDGWWNFRAFLDSCVERMLATYPISARYMKFIRHELRYLNAFDADFGYTTDYGFIDKYFRIKTSMPDELIARYVAEQSGLQVAQNISFPVATMPDARGFIRAAGGKKNDVPAVILDLFIREDLKKPDCRNKEEILSWFDNAHIIIRDLFQLVINDELKAKMGSRTEVAKK